MALKPHQDVIADDINFACETVAEKGKLVSFLATGNVGISTDLADKTAGLLLTEVIAGIHPSNIAISELTGTINTARNFNKEQTHVSGQVRLLKIGQAVTNAVSGSFSPGSPVYHQAGGLLTATDTGGTLVGHALSEVDADGYVKVFINVV